MGKLLCCRPSERSGVSEGRSNVCFMTSTLAPLQSFPDGVQWRVSMRSTGRRPFGGRVVDAYGFGAGCRRDRHHGVASAGRCAAAGRDRRGRCPRLGQPTGCSSTRAWLRSAHRIAPYEAAKLVSTAKSLRTELPAVAGALGAGAISLTHAEVIVTAIGDLQAETPSSPRPRLRVAGM